MFPWPRLICWSSDYDDGIQEMEIPQLSEDRKQWLQQALISAKIDEMEEMRDIAARFEKTRCDMKELEDKIKKLETLNNREYSSEINDDRCRIAEASALFEAALQPNLPRELLSPLLSLISNAAANNWLSQEASPRIEYERLIPAVQNSSGLSRIRSLSTLASLVQADSIHVHIFLLNGGIELFRKILENENNQDILLLTLNIATTLISYSEVLTQQEIFVSLSDINEYNAKMRCRKAELSKSIIRCLRLGEEIVLEGKRSKFFPNVLNLVYVLLKKESFPELSLAVGFFMKNMREHLPQEFKNNKNSYLFGQIDELCRK